MKDSAIKTATLSALIGGGIGIIAGAILGSGTNVLLPGLGLVIAGSLIGAVVCGFFGIVLGFLFGLGAAKIKISRREDLR